MFTSEERMREGGAGERRTCTDGLMQADSGCGCNKFNKKAQYGWPVSVIVSNILFAGEYEITIFFPILSRSAFRTI